MKRSLTAPRRTTLLTLAAFASVLVAGCGADGEFAGAPVIRTDSAGVELVEYAQLPPIEASRIAIADEPDLVLGAGGAFEGPDYEFFQVWGVAQLRDGTLVVAHQGSRELRFFGADGRFLRSVGRDGDGPGDFRCMQGPWVIEADTVVVYDCTLRRYQHFGPDGDFVRATSMTPVPFTEFSTGPPWAQAVLEHGRVAVFLESAGRPTDGAERLPSLVALHRIGDGGWDSVRVIPGPEQILEIRDGFLGRPGYHLGVFPVGAGAGATMAVADAAGFRVKLFDPDGRIVSILSASVPDVPVTSDVIEGQVEHWMAHAPEGALEGGAGAVAAYRERIRESVLTNHAPFLPAIRDVFVDADERIWVERYDVPARGPSRWEVFQRDGTWIGRVEMPEGFARGMRAWFPWAPYFSVASGRLAGVWPDPDTGVETVRVYRLVEPGS